MIPLTSSLKGLVPYYRIMLDDAKHHDWRWYVPLVSSLLVCVTSEYLLTYPILPPQLLQDSGNEDEGEDGDAEDGSYDQSNGEGEGVGVSDLFDALFEISMNTEEFLEKEEGDFIHTTFISFSSLPSSVSISSSPFTSI